ncbi:hypothetical protein SAMN06265365_104206 [Tistlia consotensis]|uniref:Uncharacterized protein n=1 Tax=Tistlia consotensis USBA 355 TaxID=560819 RepID=A0A1Y6BW40_9PROT|nr:hypothetical protein [Tistlia consotensis]SMF21300.1 hypothetical protein SAMN05428998_10788 [Tistlia consotensis USBA 355]SNR47061.1 hypothetical protein SAMN06265365_104206 [Tistlia consotensis]
MAKRYAVAFAFGAIAALATTPGWAQESGQVAPGAVQLGQATDTAGQELPDDATLLADVLAALPAGVTLETATDDQIAAAVQNVTATLSTPGTGTTPGAPAIDIGTITSQVLSVVSVTLDSIGRSTSANNVSTQVVNTLPPQVRAQVQQQVASSRGNPTPSQIAAVGGFISGTIQPAAGQQQQQQQVNLPIIQPGQQSLGQSVFQENPNQVSPS